VCDRVILVHILWFITRNKVNLSRYGGDFSCGDYNTWINVVQKHAYGLYTKSDITIFCGLTYIFLMSQLRYSPVLCHLY